MVFTGPFLTNKFETDKFFLIIKRFRLSVWICREFIFKYIVDGLDSHKHQSHTGTQLNRLFASSISTTETQVQIPAHYKYNLAPTHE